MTPIKLILDSWKRFGFKVAWFNTKFFIKNEIEIRKYK